MRMRKLTDRAGLVASGVGLGLLAIVASGLAGCSGGSRGSGHTEPPVASTPTLLASTDLRLPLDAFMVAAEEHGRLTAAQRVLIRQCALKYGVDVRPPQPRQAARLLGNQRRYGLTDEAAAGTYGYGLPPGAVNDGEPPREPDLDPAAVSVLSGEGQRSHNGRPIPERGCVGEAQRGLAGAGPSVADANLAHRLSTESFARSQQDSRVRTAGSRWSECMRAEGFDYSSPLDPAGDPRFAKGVPPEEIATARADIACKKQTNLIGIWFSVESAYQARLIEEHHEALNLIKESVAAQLRYAAELAS